MASPPAFLISATTSSAGEVSEPSPAGEPPRSFTTTRQPSLASSSASPRPIPRPAPVTIATFPSSLPAILVPFVVESCVAAATVSAANSSTRWRQGHGHRYHDSMPTLLAVIPPPDDESYSFAGTIALAADAGWDCLVHCATYGEGGERHDGGSPGRNALADAREAALRESCRILGARP